MHGYRPRENERLGDQAGALVDLLHSDTAYPAGSLVLEAGCGIGAQTVTLAQRSPQARFTSVDVSADSIAEAQRRADQAGLTNVEFRQADIFALPFAAESFDHVFVFPRMVYVDASRPDLVDSFTRKTFTAMIEGVRQPAIETGLMEPESFDAGVRALHRTTKADGVFCYTFFKGVGEKRGR